MTALDFGLLENKMHCSKQLLRRGAYPFGKVYSLKANRQNVYSSVAFLVEEAMLAWIGTYFMKVGLKDRHRQYARHMQTLIDST